MGRSGLRDSAGDTPVADGGSIPAKGTIVASRTFREGAIFLYKRGDYKKPTWLCRIKVPGGKGFITRSTGTGDEHKAFKFADDLYNQLLVKSLSGQPVVGKRIGPVIDSYVKRLEPQKERLSIHYKILLMKRVKPFLDRKLFEEFTTATISQLIDFLAAKAPKRSLSPNTIKRTFSDLKHFLNWCHEEGHLAAMPKFGQHTAEAHPGGDDAIDLLDRDLGLGPVFLQGRRHAGLVHARGIARPAFRQEQPQAQHERNCARSQRHRHQRLTVGILAERRSTGDCAAPRFRSPSDN